ncbi:hypothetical protein Poli38472_013974 [Pythium oligandrum]|uniref:RRM domain-containing protein n=1 Tax=Pythium oligandrum TaxID=41045 RepID=A0A8K1FP86_PYTOL|nr:hypothetical protein Poli38472_013974 [Pythium oligandrum]|eukprot:TMW66662.1 hypothetical protein Poli38472_013974 [Pythium oligandrum]
MNVIAEIQRINERELELHVPFEASWHQKYKESAWVYMGGLPFELTEGDVLCVMSQFGEIEDINLVRDGKTGKSKGFAFLKYENWLSTVLAVDNMNNARLLERVLRVDHVLKYKLPKEVRDREEEREAQLLAESSASDDEEEDEKKKKAKRSEKDASKRRGLPGHAYEGKELATKYDIAQGHNVFDAPDESKKEKKKKKKDKKKKEKKSKKKHDDIHELEQKQAKWMEEVRLKRQAQREAEARERALRGDDEGMAQPSETGWRGRLEPTVSQPTKRPMDDEGERGFQEREQKRRAAYGGINRVR